MATYGFYTDVYMGSAIGEKEFSPLAARAEAALQHFERKYRAECPGQDSRDMAICAMAEELRRFGKHDGLVSASVGGVSVRYSDGSGSRLLGRLYRQAQIYMDFHREVGR